MWILRFDYRFHYGNRLKETAAPTPAHISSEVTDRVARCSYDEWHTSHVRWLYRLTVLLRPLKTSGFYPLRSSNDFRRESNIKRIFVDSTAIIL